MADHGPVLRQRTGMDRGRVQSLVDESLQDADDGELFLEYRQSESFAFDDGRLKAASFDTMQGFGLQVRGRRGHRLCPRLGALRGRDSPRRRDRPGRDQGLFAARIAAPPAAHQCEALFATPTR